MACYDKTSCSVDPTTGALTIYTKTGQCTVVPGDDVTITETPECFIITINGVPTCIPKIEPGDDVSFTETDECYLITINNTPHCIPKCRYYRDCNGNVLDDCARIVTCDDLEGRGFISCIDDDDFALVPRMTPLGLRECLTIKWDQICVEAEEVTVLPQNAKVLICGPGGVKKVDPSIILEEMCFDNVADMGTTCGTTEQLVLYRDETGCRKLGLISQAASRSMISNMAEIWTHLPADTSGFIVPNNFVQPTNFYDLATFQSDGGVDHNPYLGGQFGNDRRTAPGVNSARITNSRIAVFSGENACPRVYDGLLVTSRHGGLTDLATADATVFQMSSRMRYKTGANTWTPWLYAFNPGPGTLSPYFSNNAIARSNENNFNIYMLAGEYELEFFYMAPQDTPLRLGANTYTSGFGTPAPRVSLKPRMTG